METDVERKLWWALHEQLPGWKFRRQHPVRTFVVDLACPRRKLAIELDGGQHAETTDADERRSREIAEQGYRVIRFWNHDVVENIEGVLETIASALGAFPTSPGLSAPMGRRGDITEE
jgi:very-short-patch-repair endonuclease